MVRRALEFYAWTASLDLATYLHRPHERNHVMRNQILALVALAVAASATAPAGAAARLGSTSQTANQGPNRFGRAQFAVDATHKKLLYVSDNVNNAIYVYNLQSNQQMPQPIYTITNGLAGPQGISTDRQGNLYVANLYNNTVTVYAPGAVSPKLTIPNLNSPTDVKVDGFGNVYVSDAPGGSFQSNVVQFPPGGTTPSEVWYTMYGDWTIIGIALANPMIQDATSVFASTYVVNGSENFFGYVLSCLPNSQNRTCNPLNTPQMGHTVGIAVMQSQTARKPLSFAIVDQYIPGIDIYANGQLVRQVTTGGTPEYIAFSATKSDIFVGQNTANGHVDELSWPSGKRVNQFFPPSSAYEPLIVGVAVSPAGTYF